MKIELEVLKGVQIGIGRSQEYFVSLNSLNARDAKMKELLLELSRLYCDKRFKELELLLEEGLK